jgi:predicted dehydrogenase
MAEQRLRVGIVGLQPGRSWAARAHIPALRAMANQYEIIGVANSSCASAEAAAVACGVPRAFDNVGALVESPDVDVVAVTVKVPHHLNLAKAAIEKGKHVFCEWPLGNGLAEAEELAGLAKDHDVLGVVGTQARVAPEIQYLRRLLSEGFIGEILSTTLTARAGGWGGIVDKKATGAYLLDRANGATMLTIPIGHTLAALLDVLGDVTELSAVVTTRRHEARAMDTGESLCMTAPDQVLVAGVLANGAPLSVHYRGGMPRDEIGLIWEINGTEGDVRITGPLGHAQMVQLSLSGGRGDEPLRPLQIPPSFRTGAPADVVPGNVARVYARLANDVRQGTRTAPNFDDAVELHKLIAGIETAAESGRRVSLQASNRAIPIIG